jgi:hypothetical protein
MALERLEALEARVRGMVELIQDLKRKNAALEKDLRHVRERLMKEEEVSRRWSTERLGIKSRIERALRELDFLTGLEESKEESHG